VAQKIDPDDLIDSLGVAEILTLASRASVSTYQKRYQDMPRPVVELGEGRIRLWSRSAMLKWATKTGRVRTK
jgi:glutathione-regulated potassium-efflux system ancillary protein KefG